MATIWFLKEGEIQQGPAIAEKPLKWCEENLGLRLDNWVASLETRNLTIGQKSDKGLGPYRGFRFAVIEVTDADLRGRDKATFERGYYLLDMDAQEAKKVLEKSK